MSNQPNLPQWDIRILGLKQLDDLFRTLPATIQAKCLRPALRAAAKDLKSAVQAAAPRKSGRLAMTFKVRARKRQRGVMGVDVCTGDRDELGIPATRKDGWPRGYYPASVEFGTKKPRRGRGKRPFKRRRIRSQRMAELLAASDGVYLSEFGGHKQPPRPFIRPTVVRLYSAMIQKIGAVLSERVNSLKSVSTETEVFGGGGLEGEVL